MIRVPRHPGLPRRGHKRQMHREDRIDCLPCCLRATRCPPCPSADPNDFRLSPTLTFLRSRSPTWHPLPATEPTLHPSVRGMATMPSVGPAHLAIPSPLAWFPPITPTREGLLEKAARCPIIPRICDIRIRTVRSHRQPTSAPTPPTTCVTMHHQPTCATHPNLSLLHPARLSSVHASLLHASPVATASLAAMAFAQHARLAPT